jgi:outer membrane protein
MNMSQKERYWMGKKVRRTHAEGIFVIITALLVMSMMILGSSNFVSAASEPQVLTLDQAVKVAMENSLQRQIAQSDAAIAQDKLKQAQSGYWPKLTLEAGYTHYNEVPTSVALGENLVKLNNALDSMAALQKNYGTYSDPYGYGGASKLDSALSQEPDLDQSLNYYGWDLVFQQPLYTGNKLTALNKQAKANQGYAKANLSAADQNLVFEVKKAYYTVISTQHLVETMQQAVDDMENHVKEADAYCRAGMVAKLDVKRAEVKLADLKQKLLMAQNGLELADMALNFTMGISLETKYKLVDNVKYEPFQMDLPTCQEKALINRPEVAAINAKVEMAKQNLEIAKSAGRPLVALQAKHEDITPYNPDPENQIGIVATMKLIDGGQIRNQVKEAEEVVKQAQTAQELTNRAIKLDVEQAYRNLQVALQTIQVAEKSMDQAQETLHMADVSYKAGLSSSLERIDAEVGLTQAKTNYTQALSMYNIALAQLQKAIGQ